MTRDLRIALIQSGIYWHDAEANLASFEEKIWQIAEPVDLIVLPEMFNTGYSMDTGRIAEHPHGRTFRWMQQMSAQSNAAIAGSVMIREKEEYFNRLIWMEPDGNFRHYDKRHLFRMAGEEKSFSPGKERLITEWRGWKICPLICYDLRFPAWSRNQYSGQEKKLTYDLAVYVANWPASRIQAWETLLKARAIENYCYVAGLNRTGKDGNGTEYNGHSNIIDPKGNGYIENSGDNYIKSITLSHHNLMEYRQKFPAFLDGDRFKFTE